MCERSTNIRNKHASKFTQVAKSQRIKMPKYKLNKIKNIYEKKWKYRIEMNYMAQHTTSIYIVCVCITFLFCNQQKTAQELLNKHANISIGYVHVDNKKKITSEKGEWDTHNHINNIFRYDGEKGGRAQKQQHWNKRKEKTKNKNWENKYIQRGSHILHMHAYFHWGRPMAVAIDADVVVNTHSLSLSLYSTLKPSQSLYSNKFTTKHSQKYHSFTQRTWRSRTFFYFRFRKFVFFSYFIP